jgi:hypothetical protein
MSYQLQVIKDFPIGFWPLDESSGTTAYDISGCSNDATYYGSITTNILPLIPGGVSASIINSTNYITFPITKDYYGQSTISGFGTSYNSDNDFSIELWFKPVITSENAVPIFADLDSDVGLFYENGSLLFSLEDTKLYATPRNINKAMHVVATYSQEVASIWVDGILLESVQLNNFNFTNTSIEFSCGPTDNSDYFIVDAPAVYRYSLNESIIKKHYNLCKTRTANQIVYPDNGYLFSMNDDNIREIFYYRYPVNKSFRSLANENLSYDYTDESIKLIKGESGNKNGVILDYIVVPISSEMNASKIEWEGSNGIFVYTNTTGEDEDYIQCVNGESIPQYNSDYMDPSGKLYIKIVFASPDCSKFFPYMNYFNISFYRQKKIYADNSGETINALNKDIFFGGSHHNLLSRSNFNGLRTQQGGGFVLNTSKAIKSIEFFMTPTSRNATTLLSATDTSLSWASGAISKSNISKIYVNGVDRSSITTVASLLPYLNDLYHIVIVFNNTITGEVLFNSGSQDPETIYNKLAIYEYELNQSKVLEHYNLYTEIPSSTTPGGTLTMTESSIKAFDVNWQVIQSR